MNKILPFFVVVVVVVVVVCVCVCVFKKTMILLRISYLSLFQLDFKKF